MKLPNLTLKNIMKPKESKLFLALLPTVQQKRARQFTSLSLTFITIAFFALFAISPTLGTIADLQKQLDDRNFVNTQLQRKIANLTSLQTQYTNLQPNLAPIFSALPENPQADTFIGQIHQISQNTNVQLTRVQTLPFTISPDTFSSTKYVAYAFAIEGEGDISSLENFIQQVGSFNRLISFDSIDYSRVGRIAATFRASIRGKVYFMSGGTQ